VIVAEADAHRASTAPKAARTPIKCMVAMPQERCVLYQDPGLLQAPKAHRQRIEMRLLRLARVKVAAAGEIVGRRIRSKPAALLHDWYIHIRLVLKRLRAWRNKASMCCCC
jgi:hypothetical protein